MWVLQVRKGPDIAQQEWDQPGSPGRSVGAGDPTWLDYLPISTSY